MIYMWVQAVRYDLFSSVVFLPCFSMFIFSLPLLGLGSKSTSLSPGFCVCRPRQYDAICWELNLISAFFAFFWLIVWADGINTCGWFPNQIPSVRWISHHSLHFYIYQIVPFAPGIPCPLYCFCESWGDVIGWGWLLHIRVSVGVQGGGLIS